VLAILLHFLQQLKPVIDVDLPLGLIPVEAQGGIALVGGQK
jgi:hypothetical protein